MKLRKILLNTIATAALALAAIMVPAVPAYAAGSPACPSGSSSKGQVLQGIGETGGNCDTSQVNSTLQAVVTILSYVIGAASIIVIMISGFKYIISGGEQSKVANAKGSLLYAVVGLAVAASAQLLIHFVLFQTTP